MTVCWMRIPVLLDRPFQAMWTGLWNFMDTSLLDVDGSNQHD